MTDRLAEDVKSIIAEILEIKPPDIAAYFETKETSIQIDSVAMLEIVVVLERRFQITIQETELKTISDWQSLIDLIRTKKAV